MYKKSTSTASDTQEKLQVSVLSEAGLDFLVGDPEELSRFMNISGYDPDTLRASIGTPEFELAVLNYFASNEPALLAMCANKGIQATDFMRIWHKQNM